MMRATRRGMMAGGLAGALAMPTVAGLASWRWQQGIGPERGSRLLFDPTLEAGRRFAEAGRRAGGTVLAMEGDPVRFAQDVLREEPALLAGIGRHADALLVEEVALEAGYARIATLQGSARCTAADCRPGWQALGRMAHAAGPHWPEALAAYAARPESADSAPPPATILRPARSGEQAFAWLLVRRA